MWGRKDTLVWDHQLATRLWAAANGACSNKIHNLKYRRSASKQMEKTPSQDLMTFLSKFIEHYVNKSMGIFTDVTMASSWGREQSIGGKHQNVGVLNSKYVKNDSEE